MLRFMRSAIILAAGSMMLPVAFGQSEIQPYWLSNPRLQISIAPDFNYNADALPSGKLETVVGGLAASVSFRPSYNTLFTVSAPYVRRTDSLKLPGRNSTLVSDGVGDTRVAFEAAVPLGEPSPWQIVLGGSGSIPTGRNIYNSSTLSPLGTGHYEAAGRIGLRRISDPVFVNVDAEIGEVIPRMNRGRRIAPGSTYTGQFTLGHSMSDHWIMMGSAIYSRRPNVYLTTPGSLSTVQFTQSYFIPALLYHPNDQFSLLMKVSLGLKNTSMDAAVGLVMQFNIGSVQK
jgi:hypothetical protein